MTEVYSLKEPVGVRRILTFSHECCYHVIAFISSPVQFASSISSHGCFLSLLERMVPNSLQMLLGKSQCTRAHVDLPNARIAQKVQNGAHKSSRVANVQGYNIRSFPGCENAAGKLRQKRWATAGPNSPNLGNGLIVKPCTGPEAGKGWCLHLFNNAY